MRERGIAVGNRPRLGLGVLAAVMALGAATPALAHAFGQRYDLPVPLGLYLFGAGAAVAVSFVLIALFWRNVPRSRAYPRLNLLRYPLGRVLVHPYVVQPVKAAAVFLFVVVVWLRITGSRMSGSWPASRGRPGRAGHCRRPDVRR